MRKLISAMLLLVTPLSYAQLTPAEQCVANAMAFQDKFDAYLSGGTQVGAQFYSSICERIGGNPGGGSFRWYLQSDCGSNDPAVYNSITFLVNSVDNSCYLSGSTRQAGCNEWIIFDPGSDPLNDPVYLDGNKDFAAVRRDVSELCRSYEPPTP